MTRTQIPTGWDERSTLTAFLNYTRATVHAKCAGLDDAAARLAPLPASPLMTVCGLVNHLRWVEFYWIHVVLLGRDKTVPWTDEEPDREMRIGVDHPIAVLLENYRRQCAENDELIAPLDLDTESARPSLRAGRPFTLRWILLHMTEETARHNGHLDAIREFVDGATGL